MTTAVHMTSVYRGWKILFAVAAAALATHVGYAQDTGTFRARPDETREQTERRRIQVQTWDQAKRSAKGDLPAAAEAAVLQLNLAPARSSAWHFESAHRLLHLSQDLINEGGSKSVLKLIESAQMHLREVERLSSNARERASAKSTLAYIEERFMGDLKAAALLYAEAIALSPENSPSARENSERLKRGAEFNKGLRNVIAPK